MRADLHKVLVDRPRAGGVTRRTRRPLRDRRDPESAPSRLPINIMHTKEVTDNLRPQRRWLAAQVGRPWRVVHADLCKHYPRGTRMTDHLWQHIGFEVELAPMYDAKGNPCCAAFSTGALVPLSDGRLYVNRGGVLCAAKHVARGAEVLVYRVTPTLEAWRLDGIWHAVEFTLPSTKTDVQSDAILGKCSMAARLRVYGANRRALTLRPLNRRERQTWLRGEPKRIPEVDLRYTAW